MTTLTDNHPWLEAPWRRLTSQLDRLPHALLLTGLNGLGKNRFAIELAARLLCVESQDDTPCGHCKSCRLFRAKTSPDIRIITPLEEGKSISIDQIRELTSFLVLTPHTAERKVVIVTPADVMTTQAANSLLKQLEEPPGNSVLILISHQPHKLPQTIRSRCSRIEFRTPQTGEAVSWLTQQDIDRNEIAVVLSASGGAPLAALSLAHQGYIDIRQNVLTSLLAMSTGSNPVRCAEQWQKSGGQLALDWFYGFLLDVLKLALGANKSQQQANGNTASAVDAAASRIPANKLVELITAVTEARRLIATPIDERLLLEDILIRWNKVFTQ